MWYYETKWVVVSLLLLNLYACVEENECLSDDTNNCHGNATCFDTVESFICVCDQGFSGDGVTCIGK